MQICGLAQRQQTRWGASALRKPTCHSQKEIATAASKPIAACELVRFVPTFSYEQIPEQPLQVCIVRLVVEAEAPTEVEVGGKLRRVVLAEDLDGRGHLLLADLLVLLLLGPSLETLPGETAQPHQLPSGEGRHWDTRGPAEIPPHGPAVTFKEQSGCLLSISNWRAPHGQRQKEIQAQQRTLKSPGSLSSQILSSPVYDGRTHLPRRKYMST